SASLAGHLKLGKLIVLFDSNDVVLDGDVTDSFSEDIGKRFESMGWQHLFVEDGHDLSAVTTAINIAKSKIKKQTIIKVKKKMIQIHSRKTLENVLRVWGVSTFPLKTDMI